MEPITKPKLDNIITNIKEVLRNGLYTIYDIVQICANGTNNCIDWLNENGATLKENEDERIANEEAREEAEDHRVQAEESRADYEERRAETMKQYAEAEQQREENEQDRVQEEKARQEAETERQEEFAGWKEKVDKIDNMETDISYISGDLAKCLTTAQETEVRSEQDEVYLVLKSVDGRSTAGFTLPAASSTGGAGVMSCAQVEKLDSVSSLLAKDDAIVQTMKQRLYGVDVTLAAGETKDIEILFIAGDEPVIANLGNKELTLEVMDSSMDYDEDVTVAYLETVVCHAYTNSNGYRSSTIRIVNKGSNEAVFNVRIK